MSKAILVSFATGFTFSLAACADSSEEIGSDPHTVAVTEKNPVAKANEIIASKAADSSAHSDSDKLGHVVPADPTDPKAVAAAAAINAGLVEVEWEYPPD